jgi:orotate phosphoribosyltransferase-like protein
MRILHITDLHINDFQGDKEFLRDGFYIEYLDRLHSALTKEREFPQLEGLIVTGDFVDKGKVENYEHVIKILEYLSKKFSIEQNKIFLSIGNHDYQWKKLDVTNKSEEINLKKPFKEFRNHFSKNFAIERENFTIEKIDEQNIYLAIDSTWNSQHGMPGEFSVSEVDDLIKCIRETTDANSNLLIGCHFPIISYNDNFLAGEETGWHENHIWIKGNTLRDRLKRLELKNIIWFHGDVHAGDARSEKNEAFILTSKFGGASESTEQRRQANLIEINDSSISKLTCNYEFPTHSQNQSLGDWEISTKKEIRKFKEAEQDDAVIKELFSPINNEVEKEILRKIKEGNLYKFGRFHVSKEYISLGWVDIGNLLTDKILLNRISDKCFEVIKSKELDSAETLFLGIEMIGGILASQLSIRFNIKNSIIPIRTKSDHYSEFEFSHSSSFEDLEKIKSIVIFIDIISSGNTIKSIVNEIITKNKEINIHVITIISNDIDDKLKNIPNTKSYQSFCTTLKIPIIKYDEMPDEEFVKPNLKN